MKKTYYKVVWRLYNHDLVSACRNFNFPDCFRVKYKVGEWARPVLQGSKLFVFNNLEDATAFSKGVRGTVVYQCEIQGHVGVPKYIAFFGYIKDFWRKKQHRHIIHQSFKGVPKGTRTVSAVKLVEQVY